MTFVAPVLHGVVRATNLPVALTCLAGLLILPVEAQELIKNGNFDAPTATPSTAIPLWTTFNQAGSFAGDAFYVVSGTAAPPGTGNATIGPKSAPNYAGSFQAGQGAQALLQTFTVPPFLGKVTLSYDMFVNDWNQGPVCTGLDWTVPNSECGRVDLLTASAAPLSTAAPDVIRNLYAGADPPNSTVNPYIHYSFDITANVTPGGTYQIRFATVANSFFINLGVDNVSVTFDPGDFFQAHYASNLNVGDSVINISNTGARGADLAAGTTAATTGAICANIYAFSPDEQMVACCSCPVTPNGLFSLSAQKDLISNPLTPAVPTAIIVKAIASVPVGNSCNNSASSPGALAPGMVAWGTTLHQSLGAGPAARSVTPYELTESAFRHVSLSPGEFARLTQLCTFIKANGSGFGICKSCNIGGLGAVAK